MAVTIADVRNLSSTGWDNLSDDKLNDLLDDARAERDTIYSERYATLPTLDGDEDVFTKNLCAHKAEIASGGEAQSENSQGGSANYNQPQGDIWQYLSQTRYGRTCMAHIRDNLAIGIVRSGGRG